MILIEASSSNRMVTTKVKVATLHGRMNRMNLFRRLVSGQLGIVKTEIFERILTEASRMVAIVVEVATLRYRMK